jgi:hypothetical protein
MVERVGVGGDGCGRAWHDGGFDDGRLRLQPLRIAIYGTPSLVNASSP